jgi:hypothetical protein
VDAVTAHIAYELAARQRGSDEEALIGRISGLRSQLEEQAAALAAKPVLPGPLLDGLLRDAQRQADRALEAVEAACRGLDAGAAKRLRLDAGAAVEAIIELVVDLQAATAGGARYGGGGGRPRSSPGGGGGGGGGGNHIPSSVAERLKEIYQSARSSL